jgi:hypothetical protein
MLADPLAVRFRPLALVRFSHGSNRSDYASRLGIKAIPRPYPEWNIGYVEIGDLIAGDRVFQSQKKWRMLAVAAPVREDAAPVDEKPHRITPERKVPYCHMQIAIEIIAHGILGINARIDVDLAFPNAGLPFNPGANERSVQIDAVAAAAIGNAADGHGKLIGRCAQQTWTPGFGLNGITTGIPHD